MKYDHLGVLTNSIKDSIEVYSLLGYTHGDILIEDVQQVKICFLRNDEGPTIELVEPLNEESSVNKLLAKNGVTPYHSCFVTPDIDVEYERLIKEGFVPLFIPGESSAMDNKRICYFYHKKAGFIELVEEKL